MHLGGLVTAMVTPFIDGHLDLKGLSSNIQHQLSQGVDGILVLGTTGEASTLTHEEHERIIAFAVAETAGRVPVWVGTGSYCTQQTIEKTKRAKSLGADVALIVTPYYNRPGQEGIYRHFEAVAHNVDIPIVVYNIPGRCGTNIETSTMRRIAKLPNIVGVKEASSSIHQVGDVLQMIATESPNFKVFSGDDLLTLPLMALGAVGVVSVVSNLIPERIKALVTAAAEGNFALARDLHFELMPLYKAAFIETNPVPIKAAMQLCGMPAGSCRLPLYQMSDENTRFMHQLLEQYQLLNQEAYCETKSQYGPAAGQLSFS